MAFVSDSTVTPARRLLPVRDTRGRFVKPPLPSVAELLAEIADEIDNQEARPELPTPPLLAAGVVPSEETPMAIPKSGASSGGMPKSGNTPDAIRPDTDSPALSRSVSNYPDAAGVVAGRARALHLRRQLEAAAEFGADLLAALGLPRLVGPDFRCVDIDTAGDALDHAINLLDTLGDDPDLEDGIDDEATGDDELSLGWREAVAQLDLGQASDDGEHSLGAPERCPWSPAMGAPWYKPARGARPVRCFDTRAWNQAQWAQGERQDGEGEAEAGYDLPEGDDEKCGSEHDGCEPEDHEAELGAPIGDGDQEHWAQGQDGETVNEDGDGETGPDANQPHDYARPTSPRRPDPMGHRLSEERRAISRRARDTKARMRPEAPRDPDTLTIYRDGRAYWSGPYVTRDGVPVLGCAT